MLCTLGNNPVVMPDPAGELATWLRENWPEIESQLQTIAESHQHRQSGYGNIYGPGWRKTPICKLNALYWPTGHSRAPFGFFLADDATRNKIYRPSGGSTDTAFNATLRMGNETTATLRIVLQLLEPLALLGAPSATPLWIIPLSDHRTDNVNTLPYYLEGEIDEDGRWWGSDVDPVPAYRTFDMRVLSNGRYCPAELCDIMGWSHQRRAIRYMNADDNYQPNLRWHAASESVELIDEQIEQFKGLRIAGGCVEDGSIARTIRFRHGWIKDYHRIQVMGREGQMPRTEWSDGLLPVSEFQIPNAALWGSYSFLYTPSTSRPKLRPPMVVTCSMPFDGGNNSDLEDFHLQWIDDYLAWSSRQCSIVYAGIVDWHSTGHDDYTMWETWPRPLTRVVGLPPDARIGQNIANYQWTNTTTGDMPDICRAYGNMVAKAGIFYSGQFYLNRTGSVGSYVYDRAISVKDPMNFIPTTAGNMEVLVAWTEAQEWTIIQTLQSEVTVAKEVALQGASYGDTCVKAMNTLLTFRVAAPVAQSGPVAKGDPAARCGSYSGGGGGGGGGLGDDTPDWEMGLGLVYQGDATYFIDEGGNPEDFKPPSYHPAGPPDDWFYFETESGTAWWYSPSTGIYIWVSD